MIIGSSMNKMLFWIAASGWVCGLMIHLLSVAGVYVPEIMPFTWVLHIGIFVVWLPAVLSLKKNEELKEYQQSGPLKRMDPIGVSKIIFRQTPKWIIIIAVGSFIYAWISFMIFALNQNGTPSVKDGIYILHNHGNLIKVLTQQEYYHYKANEVRGYSGHWLVFYGLAAAILFPYKKTESTSLQ